MTRQPGNLTVFGRTAPSEGVGSFGCSKCCRLTGCGPLARPGATRMS